jgi:redox-sensitive bicupin YhaK (pirin superfamily)
MTTAAPATAPQALIARIEPLGFPWKTSDPFLFCAYHLDEYPAGDARFAPKADLRGRNMGSDFSRKDGWSMYHGRTAPGFPQHPHRGFETITVARRGLIDHSDSLGAAARFGRGDAQWITAGKGIVHAEMFPLLNGDAPNPTELFQVWLNLPQSNKFADPHFTMLWGEDLPKHVIGPPGKAATVITIAGAWGGKRPPSPPPNSYASMTGADIAVWTIDLEPGAGFELPAVAPGVERSLYFYRGAQIRVGDQTVPVMRRMVLAPEVAVPLEGLGETAELFLLQGQPIKEPVAQHGPFVMNTREEIRDAFMDYRRTGFGGWPWPASDPVHGRKGRFARHADGRVETREG